MRSTASHRVRSPSTRSARETQLARKPANLSFAQAAVVPVSAATALRALVDVGRVQPGQSVLVLGASGGVGSYAVQLAKAFGAEVTGVCSTAKTDLVTSLGADHVIDYTRDDFADGTRDLRPGARHRRQPLAEAAPAGPQASRDRRLRRRRGRRASSPGWADSCAACSSPPS